MTLVPRQPRPLVRDPESLRDDRLFIVACDDTFAPKQYFDFYRLPRIQIHVVRTPDGTSAAPYVLERLLQKEHEPDDERWMLLDTDHYIQGTHLATFVQALAEARRQGVNVALSKPCFEIWLLLHHLDDAALGNLPAARDVEERLRSVLGEYNKTNLKRAHYPHASVYDACVRAERLGRTVEAGDIPRENTTRVYLLWRSIVAKAIPQQLPPDLRALRKLVIGT